MTTTSRGLTNAPALKSAKKFSSSSARSGVKTQAMIGFGTDKKWNKTTIYPEWGSFPNTVDGVPEEWDTFTEAEYKKNAEIEVMHGRWAMLAVSGVWAQENAGTGPWWQAGQECTFEQCKISYVGNDFTSSYGGALFGLIFFEILLVGGAEAYRTGLLENPFKDDLPYGTPYAGGRFDPLNYAKKQDLDMMKIRELKHGRLAMLAWLGILGQSVATESGAIENVGQHMRDIYHCNVVDHTGCGF